jgi:hypothetical protein
MELKTEENVMSKQIYKDIYKTSFDSTVKSVAKSLHKKMADDIKKWRLTDEYSWRSIASVFVEKYAEFSEKHNIISGNQVSGVMLCDAAMIKLKETIEQGWN